MITINREKINEIPVLIVTKSDLQTESLPAVIYYHGFYGQKQDSLTIAYNIASAGIRVVLPDAYMHGERGMNSTKAIDIAFWDIVLQNVQDIETIYHYLCEEKLFDPSSSRFGLGGTSMGGMTTAASLTQYQWIDCAAIVMGSPHLSQFANYLIHIYNEQNEEKLDQTMIEETLKKIAPYDLGMMPEKLGERPLFFWHGTEDQLVPMAQSRSFYEENKDASYGKHQLKYVKEAGRAHHVSRLAVAETSAWFINHVKNNV